MAHRQPDQPDTAPIQEAAAPPQPSPALPDDNSQTLEGLRTRQATLEARNQKLERALAELRSARSRGDQPGPAGDDSATPTLAASERTLRDLLDAAPYGSHIYELHPDGSLVFCGANRAADRILGVDHRQFLGRTIEVAFPALQHTDIPAAYRAAAADGVKYETELIEYEDEKIAGAFEVSACQMGNNRMVAFFRDVTERKQAEQEQERLLSEVQHRAAELDAVIESIPDGVVIYGPGAKIVRMNAAAESLLGYTPEEQKLPFPARVALLRAETAEGIPLTAENAPFVRALDEETVQNVIVVLHPPRDEPVWISFSAAPILDAAGTLRGAVGIFTNVTTLHELQEQREDFLRAVSHDLGTPLVSIGGFAQLLLRQLEETGADEKQLKYLHFILTDTKRMRTMIRDLVDSVRLEAGQLPTETEPVSLAAFVSDWLGRAAGAMEVARIQASIPVNLPPLWVDPNRLDRVLTNLLTNALKYSEPETAVVIAAEQTGKEVTVSVTDQGAGIDPGDLPHIFERFYRVPGARKVESVGLGLYITKMLVEALGGRIWAESEPGRGSTFHFLLPLA